MTRWKTMKKNKESDKQLETLAEDLAECTRGGAYGPIDYMRVARNFLELYDVQRKKKK